MAKAKESKSNGKATQSKARNVLDDATPDLFGDSAQNELAVDFGEIDAKALHSVIARVCKFGGYIAFSAPAGGSAVKLVVSVGGATGQRWNHDGRDLANNVLHVHKILEKLSDGS